MQNIGTYTPLTFPNYMERSFHEFCSILFVVVRFLKMAHCVACKRTINALHVVHLFFEEIVWLHAMPKSIVSDRDVKSENHFWRHL